MSAAGSTGFPGKLAISGPVSVGIYTMKNTLVGGGGERVAGDNKLRAREKMKKNGGKLHKNREKGRKNASFWVINSKNFRKLIRRGKKNGGKLHKDREKVLKNVSFWGINYRKKDHYDLPSSIAIFNIGQMVQLRMSDWCQMNCLSYPQNCPASICKCIDQCRYCYCINCAW